MEKEKEHKLMNNALESLRNECTCIPEYFNQCFATFYATEAKDWLDRILRQKIDKQAERFQFFWDDNTKLFTIEDLGDDVHMTDLRP